MTSKRGRKIGAVRVGGVGGVLLWGLWGGGGGGGCLGGGAKDRVDVGPGFLSNRRTPTLRKKGGEDQRKEGSTRGKRRIADVGEEGKGGWEKKIVAADSGLRKRPL